MTKKEKSAYSASVTGGGNLLDETIQELYEKLNSKGFQNTEEGDLFYNFFIYQYPASDF